MDFVRKLNIRKSTLFDRIKAIPGTDNKQIFCLKAVFIHNGDQWKYLVGTCSINDDKQSAYEEKYKGFYFVSKVIEGTLLEIIEHLYAGYSLHKDMPDIKFSEDTNWEEELIPSHASKTQYPIRVYTSKVYNVNNFNDTKLIGYQAKFHASAKKYIRDFLDLLGPLDRKDSKEGGFLIGLEDTRNRISIENNFLSIEVKDKESSLVGEVNQRDIKTFTPQESISIDDIETVELWLLNRQEEVLDYMSSSEWPHVYLSSKDIREIIGNSDYGPMIQEGEGSRCEFKPYIALRANQNSKFDQVIRTVCAFSNTQGGHLFIGINDNAEIVDITATLCKEYKCETDQAIDSYIADIKKRLKENITKDDCFTVYCEPVFSKPVVIISVEPVDDINTVRGERTAYVRKGSSSMKMLPEEIQNRSKKVLF
ncbi:MAG: AlbA family DNA-binding domain-containing protein [Alphaproteobacteria bacterium]